MTTILIMSIYHIALLTLIIIVLFIKLYDARYKLKHINDPISPKHSIKRALYIKDIVELEGGVELEWVYDKSFNPPDLVYIKYFNHYEPMIVIMFDYQNGYVLALQDREGSPRYYRVDEVYLDHPRESYVEGYTVNTDEDIVFYITRVLNQDELVKEEGNKLLGKILPHL